MLSHHGTSWYCAGLLIPFPQGFPGSNPGGGVLMTHTYEDRLKEIELRKNLEKLDEKSFIQLFRYFLDIKEYPYPDESLNQERDNAINVLIADIPAQEIDIKIREFKN